MNNSMDIKINLFAGKPNENMSPGIS